MPDDEAPLATLERLAASTSVRDRAFAASALALGRHEHEAERAAQLYKRIDETARSQHAALVARIREGNLEREGLLALLEAEAPDARDHLVEEILGIAYPPFEPPSREREPTLDNPSGFAEISFGFEQARLGPDHTLVDLGAGQGKVVLLAALLTGARALGIELDPRAVTRAQAAAAALGLDRAEFVQGDIRSAPLPEADVYYMFSPFLGSAEVVRRLRPIAVRRQIRLLCQPLDLKALPWLKATGARRYWLEVYESA
jgi:hypothetical protein